MSICYLCGKDGADTADHVPPKALFPKRFHKDIPEVPAHRSCNNNLSKSDTYFRDVLVMASTESHPIAKEMWEFKVKNSLGRAEAKKYAEYLRNCCLNVLDKDGNKQFAVDANRINSQIERILRGVFYAILKNPLRLEIPFSTKQVKLDSTVRALTEPPHSQIADGAFKIKISVPNPDTVYGMAYTCFYDNIGFITTIGKEPKLS